LTNSSEGYGSSDSKNIEVTQPSTDEPTNGPPTNGPPTNGVIIQPAMSLALNPSVLEVYETKSISSTLRVKNAGGLNLNNVKISIADLQADWYSIQPDSYDMIIPGDTRTVILSFTPTQAGTYDFKITVKAGTLSETIDATLNVLALPPGVECGNNECETGEDYINCPEDCSAPPSQEEIERRLAIIRPLLIVSGMIAPAIIAVFMIFTLLVERCPMCGSKMKVEYKGKYVTGYRCIKCKHFEVKEIRKK